MGMGEPMFTLLRQYPGPGLQLMLEKASFKRVLDRLHNSHVNSGSFRFDTRHIS